MSARLDEKIKQYITTVFEDYYEMYLQKAHDERKQKHTRGTYKRYREALREFRKAKREFLKRFRRQSRDEQEDEIDAQMQY